MKVDTARLGRRISDSEALAVLSLVREEECFHEFAQSLFVDDRYISRNAAWILTKATDNELMPLMPLREQLIDLILRTNNTSLQRLTMNIIERLPMTKDDVRTDFLDFCLNYMVKLEEPSGSQALCMKIAHKMCSFYPELMEELNRTLTGMDMAYYKPAVKCVRNKILKNQRS